MDTIRNGLLVVTGGGIGAYLRYLVHSGVQTKTTGIFPYSTLVVNVSGAFLIGFVMSAFLERTASPHYWRLFLVVGVLGGYTTFSALAWESYQLVQSGQTSHAGAYILASLAGGALGLMGGVLVGRLL